MALNKEPSGDAVLRSRLRSAVRRERADIAALRADIASASVAFERGKNALEVALQSTPLHPNPSSQGYRGAAEEDDAALARSLQAQIVATQDGLARVEQKERSLLAEVKALSAELRETEVSGGVSTSIECVQSVGTAMQQLRAAAITARRGDDAAREFGKWREHSLPNLSVMSVEGGDSDTPMSGVIVDRVFDGIVAFTAGQDRMLHSASALTSLPSASKDHEVVSCAAELTELTDRSLLIRVASGYSSMTVEDAGGTSLRIVSLTPTLECVQRLLKPHVAGAETSDVSRASLANAREAKATGVSVAHVPDVQKPSVTPAVRSVTPPARRAVVSDLTPRLSHSSRCISDAGFARVLQAAPARYHDCDLQRLYCTDTDGISMVTLLKKVANRSPVFILVRDASGHAFGCYGSTAWRDSCTRSYGSGESFVFKLNGHSANIFKWTRANTFFQLSSHEHLAIGGGGHFALWIDGELAHGTTAHCSTFDNPPLTVSRGERAKDKKDTAVDISDGEMVDFEIVVVEAWSPVLPGHLESD